MLLNGWDYLPYSTSGKCPMEIGENHVPKLKKTLRTSTLYLRGGVLYTQNQV
jgi:hypothetical protein